MKKVKLKKNWGSRKTGSTIEVDDLRAAWLEEHDYLAKSVAKRKED